MKHCGRENRTLRAREVPRCFSARGSRTKGHKGQTRYRGSISRATKIAVVFFRRAQLRQLSGDGGAEQSGRNKACQSCVAGRFSYVHPTLGPTVKKPRRCYLCGCAPGCRPGCAPLPPAAPPCPGICDLAVPLKHPSAALPSSGARYGGSVETSFCCSPQ